MRPGFDCRLPHCTGSTTSPEIDRALTFETVSEELSKDNSNRFYQTASVDHDKLLLTVSKMQAALAAAK
jgi:hypothetical protein